MGICRPTPHCLILAIGDGVYNLLLRGDLWLLYQGMDFCFVLYLAHRTEIIPTSSNCVWHWHFIKMPLLDPPYKTLSVKELHPTFGAEVHGVDFSKPISEEVFEEVLAVMAKVQIILSPFSSRSMIYQCTYEWLWTTVRILCLPQYRTKWHNSCRVLTPIRRAGWYSPVHDSRA